MFYFFKFQFKFQNFRDMKKTLLLGGLLLAVFSLNAQQRLALYEEFSGENCGPCALKNPALMNLIEANPTKVLLLKYQSPIPSAGPIYEENTVFTDARMEYYSVPFAPYGRLNGTAVGSGQNAGDIALTTQAMIDAASAGTAPFTISISNPTYSPDGQSFTATVTVTASQAATYSDLKLRFALAEQLDFATAPGTNGETSFHNVVRQMYPSAAGQSVPSTWTAGQTQTFTITGGIPSYVKPSSAHKFFAAFLQTDGDKKVLQAAKTSDITIQLPAVDIASSVLSGTTGLKCELPATINPVVTVKNTGTAPLTSATIYYRAGTGAWNNYAWTASSPVAAGATATVNLPALTINEAGQVTITDSIVLPNNKIDYNDYDNKQSGVAYILNSTATALPIGFDFETASSSYANWISWPGNTGNGFPFLKATSQGLGHNSSNGLGYFPCYSLQAGTVGYLIFPKAEMPSGAKTLEFYLSYAQYQDANGTQGDKLELVYTTDCGANWTSVWNQSNADLATAPATQQNIVPTAASWKLKSIDVSNVPTGAYFAFRGTSGFGNNMFIDDVQLRTGSTSINTLIKEGTTKVFPNPVSDKLNVELDMLASSKVSFTIYNVLGQAIGQPMTRQLSSGSSKTEISTDHLAPGMYYLNIVTESGSLQQKFNKK